MDLKRRFAVLIERGKDGYYIAEVPELPGCYSQAKTMPKLMANIREAIGLYLETLSELKRKPVK